MRNSPIEWTDDTWNLVWGCTKISPGCTNCYAETINARFGKSIWGPKSERRTMSPEYWAQPLAWDRAAKRAGIKRRVFCSSMCDVFEDHPTIDQEREKLWPLIKATPNLVWQILTKRADRIANCLPLDWGKGYPNVWLGVSVENQDSLVERVPYLVRVGAAVRFLSCEPLLGPVFIGGFPRVVLEQIHWVIVGGESGAKARPMHPRHLRIIHEDCTRWRKPFFFKQWGEWLPWLCFNDNPEIVDENPEQSRFDTLVYQPGLGEWEHHNGGWEDEPGADDLDGLNQIVGRCGKKAAGRMLDGRTWDEMPACWNGGVI